MFQGFTQQSVDFLWDIRFFNDRDWFEEHKSIYLEQLARPMKELAWEVYDRFCQDQPDLDLEPHVARIYRDARRTHGKGPYKDHLWFSFRQRREDRLESDQPVFWFELGPESWTTGLGYYQASPDTMLRHRARIDRDSRPLRKLAKALAAQDRFSLEGTDYARPKGDPGPLLRDWYNKKTFALWHEEEHGVDLTPDLVEVLAAGFRFLAPYHRYFSSLEQDPAPR